MAIDPTSVSKRIGEQHGRNAFYRSMIDGTFALPFANRDDARYQEFKRLLQWARIDIASVIVETTAERLTVAGFRTDPKSLEGDDGAFELWDRVGGPLTSQLSIVDSLSVGDSFFLVERDEDGKATLSGETSDFMTAVYAPGSRTKIDYAAKSWVERDDKGDKVTYLKLISDTQVETFVKMGEGDNGQWKSQGAEDNPFGFLPVTHLRNRPSLAKRYGRSELWGLENDIGRVNKLSADLMVLSEFSSFKVRFATGIEADTDASGTAVAPFNIGPDRLLTTPNDNAKFGTLEETSLDGILQAVKAMMGQVAALSRTPMFYLSGDIVNIGVEGLRAMDGQLVNKVLQRQLEMESAITDAERMLLRVEGSPLADGPLETIWADPRQRSFSELSDGISKLTSGPEPVLPREQAWVELGYSPLQRERMRSYATQDAARRRVQAMSAPAAGRAIANVGARLAAAQGGQQPDQQQPATA